MFSWIKRAAVKVGLVQAAPQPEPELQPVVQAIREEQAQAERSSRPPQPQQARKRSPAKAARKQARKASRK